MSFTTGDFLYDRVLWVAFGIVVFTVVATQFVQSPYGRFASRRWGPALGPRLGWFLMELPAPLVFYVCYAQGPQRVAPFPLFVLGLWTVHYLNRGFLMPLLMRVPRGQERTFGASVMLAGWLVTSIHGYLSAVWVSKLHGEPGWSWFADPRFVVGVALYGAGLAANVHADHVLRNLRSRDELARGERRYRIPHGGLFARVTNASYFAELVLWSGFALLTWSPAGLFILAISAANLVPRAVATHRWYRETFPDYPRKRRVLVPYLF
jgi:3-oxo-5-alpha-steroid 4-dehydrogenase 1